MAGGLWAPDGSLQLRVCLQNASAPAGGPGVLVSLSQPAPAPPVGATTAWRPPLLLLNGWCVDLALTGVLAGGGNLTCSFSSTNGSVWVPAAGVAPIPPPAPSAVSTAPAAPAIAPLGGPTPLGPVLVTLSGAAGGAELWVTLAGAAAAPRMRYTGPFLICTPGNTTVMATRCVRVCD